MAIIQKAFSSTGVAVFPAPTTVGNVIVVACASTTGQNLGGIPTDDAGNPYEIPSCGLSSATDNVNLESIWFFARKNVTTAFGPHSCQTVTYPNACSIWIFEIDGQPFDRGFGTEWGYDACDSNFSTPDTANPAGAGLFPTASPTAVEEIFMAVIAVGSGTVTSVDAPWALDSLSQPTMAVAYTFAQNTATQTVQFHASGSTAFAISEISFPTNLASSPSVRFNLQKLILSVKESNVPVRGRN